ncbi:MAG: winged helix-turn-helix domain-containing protein [Nanoarchaeota archaeon]|nr:winged helix-turn-helix domain-containing protein [Nanoarchaeota archaeon]
MEKEMIDAISLIKSSKYRYKVLKAIKEEVLTPSEISKKVDLRLNHVSMVLTDLKNKKLVECLNEETKKGRLYQLTKLGKNAISKF